MAKSAGNVASGEGEAEADLVSEREGSVVRGVSTAGEGDCVDGLVAVGAGLVGPPGPGEQPASTATEMAATARGRSFTSQD